MSPEVGKSRREFASSDVILLFYSVYDFPIQSEMCESVFPISDQTSQALQVAEDGTAAVPSLGNLSLSLSLDLFSERF